MIRYDVARWNSFLATRERGRRVREDVEAQLAKVAPGDTLVLDFAGVDGITVSFGDEAIAKLILARDAGDFVDRGMVVEGANEDVRETLDTLLARRKVAIVCVQASGEAAPLGEQGWLPATLLAALELQTFRATELAEKLNLTPQAANNRLRLLVASGAVAKERVVPEGGGKEFRYKAAIPAFA
jgi:hypothetical protein